MFSEPLCHGRCLGADVAEARIGSVAVAAAAGVAGVAGNADDARFHLFSEGAGLVCSFRFFCFGPLRPIRKTMDTWRGWLRIQQRWQVGRSARDRGFKGSGRLLSLQTCPRWRKPMVKSEV